MHTTSGLGRVSSRQRDPRLERPDTPAQLYAVGAGLFLIALGVLALVFDDLAFWTVGSLADQPEFLVWTVSGWTVVLWLAMGALGILAMARLSAARRYALFAGVVFTVVAAWGYVDGSDVAGLIVADATNNITHAVLGGLGLLVGLMPSSLQRAETA